MFFACIPDHTSVDTPSGPQPIENVQPGDWVVGCSGTPVRVLQKHSKLESPKTVFLHLTFAGGEEVDLYGMHRVDGIRAREIKVGQTIAGQTVAGIEFHRGVTRAYDLLTEDRRYQIQGVPVNSLIEEMHAAAASGGRSVGD